MLALLGFSLAAEQGRAGQAEWPTGAGVEVRGRGCGGTGWGSGEECPVSSGLESGVVVVVVEEVCNPIAFQAD